MRPKALAPAPAPASAKQGAQANRRINQLPNDCLVLDSDIVIHLLKKQPDIVAKFLALKAADVRLLICPIVAAEIYAGAFLHEHKDVDAFFDLCQRIDTDHETGRIAGQYAHRYRKAFQGISLEDFLLAATARRHGSALWTGNHKHYPMPDCVFFG